MWGYPIRRVAGLFALAVVALLVSAAPSLADTIQGTEGTQLTNQVVVTSDSCTATAATINWGDGTAATPGKVSGSAVSGSHKYAEEGTYSGSAHLTGGNCGASGTNDPFTADIADATLTATGVNVSTTKAAAFTGPVATFTDADPGGTTSDYTATIDWGDGASSPSDGQAVTISSPTAGKFSVSGTHTYATAGSFSIFVTITDQSKQGGAGGQAQSQAFPSSTATVAPPAPQFTQCPAVNANSGCQFLIVVSNTGTTVLGDPNQGPYENAEDALIGIQNNSSDPVLSLPLSTPGSGLFSFDGDGICNPGSPPIPSGCAPPPGSPAGTTCSGFGSSNGTPCSFPAPAGEPAGYTEPGAGTGNTQNGYEGPTTWYSNVSADTTSGQVNFSPPGLQPGQSTYFSLEEPPSLSALSSGTGGTPSGATLSGTPTVTTTGASFSGLVNPNGSLTTAYFQYGLDSRYLTPGTSGPVYNQATPVQTVGGDFADHAVNATTSGLVANALYHVRLVATNGRGTTFGPDVTFMTKANPPPPAPVLGKVNVQVVSGLVFVKLPNNEPLYTAGDIGAHATSTLAKGVGFLPLTEARQIPSGSQIDARLGTIKLIAATGTAHKTQSGTFNGALFGLAQDRRGLNKGLTTVSLLEGAFSGAPTYAACSAKKAADASSPSAFAAVSSKVLQTLHASVKGKFSSHGRYAAATVRGTVWTMSDRCDGTLVSVQRDTVAVQDFVRHITVLVHAGHRYLARAPGGHKKK